MELDAVNGKFAVLQSHDLAFACLRSDLKRWRQRLTPDDEGMVTRCFERIGQVGENAAVLVSNG